MAHDEVLQISKLAESLFGGDFEIKPVGDTLRELAQKYNQAVNANDTQLAAHASAAAAALVDAEAATVRSLMVGHYLKHAEPAK